MKFDSEFKTLIGWIEGHMIFFWRFLDNKTSQNIKKLHKPSLNQWRL